MKLWRHPCFTAVLSLFAVLERVLSKDCCNRCWSDCEAYLDTGHTTSGVYYVYPEGMRSGYDVYCDMNTDGGGWTGKFDTQSREHVAYPCTDIMLPAREICPPTMDHWHEPTYFFMAIIGGEGLHPLRRILSQGHYELRIDIEDWAGETAYATYTVFEIGPSADNFRLTVEMYIGTAGDSLSQQNGQMFSTMDRDNDDHSTTSCAVNYQSGWWFKACSRSNLNGVHQDIRDGFYYVINWYYWKNEFHSLKKVEMKIRRA